MIDGRHIAVMMPAYNTVKTQERTVLEIPDMVEHHSEDDTERAMAAGSGRQ